MEEAIVNIALHTQVIASHLFVLQESDAAIEHP